MTDGTLPTIFSLVVGMLATSFAAVVVSQARERERRRAAEHEALALRDAGLRAELQLLEVRAGNLREEIGRLEDRRADLVGAVQAPPAGSDPATEVAKGPMRKGRKTSHSELARRLERAGEAHVIPFPFLAAE